MKGVKNVSVVMNMVTDGLHEIFSRSVTNFTGFPVIGEIFYDQNIVYGLAAKSPIINYKPNSVSSINFRSLAAYMIGINYNVPKIHKIKRTLNRLKNKLVRRHVIMPQTNEDLLADISLETKK